MDDDTDIGGPRGRFPLTRGSLVHAVRSVDPTVRERAFGALVAAYWKPVYKYLRIRWQAGNEDAKDLTQAFFALALEKGFFDRYDPARARMRTYLRTCLDGFVANQRKAALRLKRGGGYETVSLDFEDAEGELRRSDVPDTTDLEEYFHREWVRALFGEAVDALRAHCAARGKTNHFLLFERYDIAGSGGPGSVSYEQLAGEFGLPVTQVTNALSWVRREFRRLVLETLQEVCASEEEYRSEARQLLGVDPE